MNRGSKVSKGAGGVFESRVAVARWLKVFAIAGVPLLVFFVLQAVGSETRAKKQRAASATMTAIVSPGGSPGGSGGLVVSTVTPVPAFAFSSPPPGGDRLHGTPFVTLPGGAVVASPVPLITPTRAARWGETFYFPVPAEIPTLQVLMTQTAVAKGP